MLSIFEVDENWFRLKWKLNKNKVGIINNKLYKNIFCVSLMM